MISKSGSGSNAAEVVYTHTLAEGWFDIGLVVDTASSDVTVRLYLNASQTGMPTGTQASPANPSVSRFLSPGDEISFDVDDSGSPEAWAFDIYLYAKGDIAREDP